MLKKEKPRLRTTTTTNFEFDFEKWVEQNMHLILFFGVIGIWMIAMILLFSTRGYTENATNYMISIIGGTI